MTDDYDTGPETFLETILKIEAQHAPKYSKSSYFGLAKFCSAILLLIIDPRTYPKSFSTIAQNCRK